ncbi:hypothetical protein ACS0TY_011089 [Phlomoides rotata]
MAFSPDKENQPHWFRNRKSLNNVLLAMRRNPPRRLPSCSPFTTTKIQDFTTLTDLVSDKTSLLSDEILLKILAKLPKSQRNANVLVSKRWLNLQGRLVRSIKLLDWDFLLSGRLFLRFPNLIHVDLVNGCLINPRDYSSGVLISNKIVPFHEFFPVLSPNEIDKGLRILASGLPNLKKLAVVNATEMGLLSVAEECPALQELSLHMCNDQVLRGIAAFQNLQILRVYGALVSDVGLTILAQGCKGLTKLELSGCRGSYEGARAIGQCCPMLEELTLSHHEMEDGWLSALSSCERLKCLRFVSCKRIDRGSEEEELCPAIETLHLDKCQLRDKKSLRALFLVCENAREVIVNNCWGLTDDMFSTATVFRRVSYLSLQGCSLLTAHGVERVINCWKEKGHLKLKNLTVKSCNNIRELSSVFLGLKNLKWEADTKSRISANLEGSGVGKRGSKFFNRKSLHPSSHT